MVGEEVYKLFKEFDLGDFWGIIGDVIKIWMGELMVWVEKIIFLFKVFCLLLDKYYGL